jgi:hypothetical protein
VLVACVAPVAAKPGKTRQLFNGKDLTNFYTWLVDYHREDPKRVFRVEDIDGAPAVRVTGNGFGGFTTKEEFENYHLSCEFSWGKATWGSRKNATKDSGVLLHCQGPDGNTGTDFNGPWMLSQECQVIQGGVGDFIMVQGQLKAGERITPKLTVKASKDRDGENVYDPKNGVEKEFQGGRVNWWGRDPDWADVLGFRGKQDVETPGSGWTHLEVICDGDKITNIVNGQVVNAGTKSSLTKGKIIFQSEGAEIYYRNINITPLR